jgi:hypothetical protein
MAAMAVAIWASQLQPLSTLYNSIILRVSSSPKLPGLVNIQKTIENGHRNSEFSH